LFYVGHFSYIGPEPEFKAEGRETGWFTLLAEAESVDAAVEKFHDLLELLGSWFTGFETVAQVFLDEITEVNGLPSAGVLAHLHMYPEDRFGHIAASLPGVPEEFCRSDGWGESGGEEGEGAVETFLSFEE